MVFLGIDLGTSSVKAVLIDDQQKIIAESSSPLTVQRPQPLFSEQNPSDWWKASTKAIQSLEKKHRADVQAIGLSGQMHGATLLDASDRVLRPAILWNDGRSFAECKELELKAPHFAEVTGNLLMPGFTAPKLLWVKKNEPEIFSQISKVLLPKDYLRLQMSGVYASDMSDSAGTSWLNVRDRKWSDEMLLATKLTQKQMPELFEGDEVTSQVTDAVAKEWGIAEKTPIVGGGGDNAASAISCGVISHGKAFLSLGTSGVYFVSSSTYKANPDGGVHTFCHCLPKLWHQMSVHLSSAACINWFKSISGKEIKELFQEVEEIASHENRLVFLPYLSGIRTPYNDPHAKGVFFGLTHNTKRPEMMRAILEGVAFDFADGQDSMMNAGIDIEDVSVIGGGAENPYWGKVLASTLQRKLSYREGRTVGGAMGAARLAWFSKHKGDPAQVFAPPKLQEEVEPEDRLTEELEKKRKTFQKLYPLLKEPFKELES